MAKGRRPYPYHPVAAHVVLVLAAADLANSGIDAFTSGQLAVAAWKRDPDRYGLSDAKDQHPDHNRVRCDMTKTPSRDTVVNRKWIEPTGVPGLWRITEAGIDAAAAIRRITR